MHFALRRSKGLIDDAFVFIKRFDENSSVLIDDFHKLGEQLEPCFYRSDHSAIDLCDDTVVSRILRLCERLLKISRCKSEDITCIVLDSKTPNIIYKALYFYDNREAFCGTTTNHSPSIRCPNGSVKRLTL